MLLGVPTVELRPSGRRMRTSSTELSADWVLCKKKGIAQTENPFSCIVPFERFNYIFPNINMYTATFDGSEHLTRHFSAVRSPTLAS